LQPGYDNSTSSNATVTVASAATRHDVKTMAAAAVMGKGSSSNVTTAPAADQQRATVTQSQR